MRGKGVHRQHQVEAEGITPAYAGKRGMEAREGDVGGDHPRVCGEKVRLPHLVLNRLGSPPRMRGKVDKHDPKRGQHRITPAYAGKRLPETYDHDRRKDHPRVCGEKAA